MRIVGEILAQENLKPPRPRRLRLSARELVVQVDACGWIHEKTKRSSALVRHHREYLHNLTNIIARLSAKAGPRVKLRMMRLPLTPKPISPMLLLQA